MKDTYIELIKGTIYYADKLDEFSVCEDVLRELFYVTKDSITLVISDKSDPYSYKVRLFYPKSTTASSSLHVEFLHMCINPEYLLNQTTKYIQQYHKELLTKSFYISILQ